MVSNIFHKNEKKSKKLGEKIPHPPDISFEGKYSQKTPSKVS
jgi:hypothetical protein